MSDEEQSPQSRWADKYKGKPTLDLIHAMSHLRADKDELEDKVSAANSELEYLAKVAIPDRFTEEGIRNMVVDGVGRVGLRANIYASIKAGCKDQAYQWMRDVGLGDLIQPSVNASTLKATLKNRIKSADDIPEDLFNVTPYQQATITKT